MISPTACSRPLRPSFRPRLAFPPPRRPSTVYAAPGARPQLPPPHDALLLAIQDHIGRESKLHRLRDVFLARGDPHLRTKQPRVPRVRCGLSFYDRKVVELQLQRCSYRADYQILVSALVAQPTLDPRFKHDAVRLVCARLYYQLVDGPPEDADVKMLQLAHNIRFNLEDAHVQLPNTLLCLALLCAATCRSLSSLKLYLHAYRRLRYTMHPHLFSLIVDRLANDYGRFYAGPSWLRPWSDKHALAVMLGFQGAPHDAPHHLSTFLPRGSWDCMTRWLRALAGRKAHRQLRVEWALWLQDWRRTKPKWCPCPEKVAVTDPAATMLNPAREPMWRLRDAGNWNTRTRGDLALLEAFCVSGCIEEAWSVLAASEIPFDLLRRRTRTAMLAHSEFVPDELWTDEMRADLLQRYADDLAKIEAEFQVEWVWDERSGTGHHRLAEGSWLAELEEFKEHLVPVLAAEEVSAVGILSPEAEDSSQAFTIRYY